MERQELDAKVIAAIKNGNVHLRTIYADVVRNSNWVGVLEIPTSATIDKSLQRLRRKNQIAYAGQQHGWVLKEAT
jgi:hypothetical protein